MMEYTIRQGLLLSVGGMIGAAIVVILARRSLLSFRYTLGWLAIFAVGVAGGLLTPLVKPLADFFGMSPTGMLLAAATVLLLGITLQLSVSISLLNERLRDVAEAHALLDAAMNIPESECQDS